MLAGSSKNSTLKMICLGSKSIAKSQEFFNVHSPFSSSCNRLFFVGVGWGGGLWGGGERAKIFKKNPKMADFCHFCSCKRGMWGQGLRPGEGQMPHPRQVTTAFFSEKHQTLLCVPERSYQNFDAMLLEK